MAELLVVGSYDGLWLMVIGWFLFSAAAAEDATARAAAALAGVTVAEVMTPHPGLAPTWSTVSNFIDLVAAQSRQAPFPVVDPGGRLRGLVLADQLARVPASARRELPIDQVALDVPSAYLAAPGDPAAPLLQHSQLGGQVAAVVLADGRVTGLATMTDLRQALPWRGLARNINVSTASSIVMRSTGDLRRRARPLNPASVTRSRSSEIHGGRHRDGRELDHGQADRPARPAVICGGALARAAGQVGASAFIEELPQDYDTIVGERGLRLSGGSLPAAGRERRKREPGVNPGLPPQR